MTIHAQQAAAYAGHWLATRVGDSGLAACAQALMQALAEGHVCVPLADLGVDAQRLAKAAPFILVDDGHAYIRRLHSAEHRLAVNLARLRRRRIEMGAVDVSGLFPVGTPEEQIRAVVAAQTSALTVITGGPGTGKTYCLQRLLAACLLQQPQLRIAVVAPTGKAAARASEALVQDLEHLPVAAELRSTIAQAAAQASTVHRLLGWNPGRGTLRHGPGSELDVDLVVVDEASMVDCLLFDALLAAMPGHARLVIVGDAYQLASVESGVVLGDLHRALGGDAALTELRVSRRFDDASGIGRFARDLRRAMGGEADAVQAAWQGLTCGDAAVSVTQSIDEALTPLLELWRGLDTQPTAAAALDKFLCGGLLTPLRDGPSGVSGLNHMVERRLGLAAGPQHGKPILITANDPASGLVNGDIGMLWNDADGAGLMACFDRDRRVALAQLPAHTACWALTVHKSQGSEWPLVAVILPDQDLPGLLGAELLYTAATRARERLLIRGSEAVVCAAAGRRSTRRSRLAEVMLR